MRRNWLEWLALAVSSAAIVGVVGFLALDGLTDDGRPPLPVIRVNGPGYAGSGGWFVPAVVTNTGDRAAEAVDLEATADLGRAEEVASVTVDYLPAGSEVDVTFGFTARPEAEVRVRVIGFRLP